MIGITDITERDLNSSYKDVAKVIGLDTALRLGKEFGGENFYLPKVQDRKRLEELADTDARYGDIVKVIGLDATFKLAREFRGESFYLPKLDGNQGPLTRARERMILSEVKTGTFRGSIVALARKYGITSRGVQLIIKRAHIKMVASQ